MEIHKSVNLNKFLIFSYCFAFLVYLIVGLTPAEAAHYDIIAKVEIPRIGLVSDVADAKIENRELKTPESVVGSFSHNENKIFLFGHVGGVFKNLANLQIGDEIIYESMIYYVESMIEEEKSMINMNEILKAEDEKTLVVMTCAGEDLGNGDSTHRLIVTAKA